MTIETPRSTYRQLADLLRQAIKDGEFPAGSTLPSEPELAAQYELSRPTVNRAITILRNEGLVRVERGRGTFVHELPAIPRMATSRYARERREAGGSARGAFQAEVSRLGFDPSSELVQIGPVVPPHDIAEALRLAEGEQALIRKRHMYASKVPVQLATSYVPWSIAEGTQLTQPDTGPGGTYSRLADLGHPVARFTEAVEVRTPTQEEEKFLRLTEEQKVYAIFHTAWTPEEVPVEITIHILPTHQWTLHYDWSAEAGTDGPVADRSSAEWT